MPMAAGPGGSVSGGGGPALRGVRAQEMAPPCGPRCVTNAYTTYRPWTNALPAPPSWYQRTNRLRVLKHGGSVGFRAEWTNAAPITLLVSRDGCPFHAELVISNGVALAVPADGRVTLYRLRQ